MSSYQECKAITELDLDPIKVKLMHKESGESWTPEYANAVEAEYRRFLYLMKVFPQEAAAPSVDVDTFWHYHILDTMKYARDCEAVFGYFLHHYPYVGLLGDDDLAVRAQMGKRMRELYEETFGGQYGAASGYCAAPNQRDSAGTGLAGSETDTGTAYCAAPSTPAVDGTARNAALLANRPAYCAAPSKPASAQLSLTSFSPDTRAAYCAAPSKPIATRTTHTAFLLTQRSAYCAAPSQRIGMNTSFDSLAPDARTAYCAAPSQPAGLPAHVAKFCAARRRRAGANAALGRSSPDAKSAYCAAPGQPIAASTAPLEPAVAVA